MNMLMGLVRRALFFVAFALGIVAVCEKLANLAGQTFLRGMTVPSRLLEFAVVVLMFLMVVQLRDLRLALERR